MDRDRVQEIIESPVMVNVNYHGFPIYIQEVLDDQDMARVFPLDNMDHEQIVDLNGLREHHL
ncbi:H-type small acid-soluble spore protein [Evansella clarkii]|uniref:H-type small acid-soluble spore protein n=1 Tax=Evansella clarkii TaxID=79879 RepID=UPI000B44F513|nr:H-type small acid-soluble spore protein [Evansella clarkii]